MQAISALRAKASGAYDDVGITTSTGAAIIAAGDANSIAFSRTPAQVRPDQHRRCARTAVSCAGMQLPKGTNISNLAQLPERTAVGLRDDLCIEMQYKNGQGVAVTS